MSYKSREKKRQLRAAGDLPQRTPRHPMALDEVDRRLLAVLSPLRWQTSRDIGRSARTPRGQTPAGLRRLHARGDVLYDGQGRWRLDTRKGGRP